ncbi:hypothetical protein [Tannerella forsythia]|uniref:hypothetical protein n=1 Tax=Tannerella forsythia TaxID=28112 RepID=UPI00163ABE7E|nr:hypothetical protein [Tannerella forsythia]
MRIETRRTLQKRKVAFFTAFLMLFIGKKIRSFVGRMGLLCLEIRTFAKINQKDQDEKSNQHQSGTCGHRAV